MPRERHCLWSANVFSWRLQGQKRGITGLLRDTCSERLECQRERGNDLDLLKETWMPRERYRFRSAQRDLNAKRKVSFSLAYIADCFVSWFRQGVWREAGLADVLARTAEPGLLQSNLRQDNRSACVIEYMLYSVHCTASSLPCEAFFLLKHLNIFTKFFLSAWQSANLCQTFYTVHWLVLLLLREKN